jgi:hypothetical protein
MRIALMAVVVAVAVVAGCAAEKQRVEREEKISAARLGGKFHYDDPLVAMLTPSEREALVRAGMMDERPEGEPAYGEDQGEGDETASTDEEKSTMDKAGDMMMSVLAVSVTLGMMAAPYLLF